ncbi:MAG: type II secretion system protein GspD [Ignavibacteriaceae bacterium]
MKTIISTVVISILFTVQIFSQEYLEKSLQTYQNPDQLVTLSPNISFNQAIALISKISEKTTGKKIVSTVQIDTAIGIEIKNMNYLKALVVIVRSAGLIYEETPDVIVVKRSGITEEKRTKDNYVSINAREVKISAVFFEADVNKERQLGINWQTLFSGANSTVGGNLNGFVPAQPQTSTGGTTTPTTGTTTVQQSPDFNITGTTNFNVGGFFGKATAVFKMFENENIGQIVSSPSITVLNGTEARLQDGQDLAIKTRDFSGNILETFYAIGSIVTVTPHVIREDGINYILLSIHVERSSFVPDPTNTIINKTSADTRVVLLDGEETVIGGMYIDQTTKVRNGIPILKDLPWWFFGLRYIFGSDQNQVIKKELVILIKAGLVPTLKERLAGPPEVNPLRNEIEKQRDKIKYYQFNESQSNDIKK